MKWNIRHCTRYEYAAPVRDSFNEVRLKPVTNEAQRVESFDLTVRPPVKVGHFTDFYANWVSHFDVSDPHCALEIDASSVVTPHPLQPLGPDARPAPLDQLSQPALQEKHFDYLQASRFVDIEPPTWRLAIDATQAQTDAWQAALAIMRFVNGFITYTPQS